MERRQSGKPFYPPKIMAWHEHRYTECATAIEKTMCYRQMVGLLTASSIRSFRNHRGGIQEDPVTTSTTECISSVDASEGSKRVTLNPNASAEEGDDPSMSHGAASATTKRRRRRRCNDSLVAMDVAFYLFHNNQSQETVVHSKQSSLSSMQQAQLLSKEFLLQLHQHHPGFVPVRLWQGFMAWEKQPLVSSIVSVREDAQTEASSAISPISAEPSSATSTTGGLVHDNHRAMLQFVPVCFDCGGIVQPGVQNTTLRLVHNGRRGCTTPTQRRRESRRKAALAQKQHQTMKQHVNHWKSAIAPHCLPDSRSKLWHYIWQQQNKYYHSQPAKDSRKVYPFMNCCKNYCIVTCGSCAAPIYLPGISSDTLPTRSNDEKKKSACMPTNASDAAMLLKHPPASTNPSVSQPKNDDTASFSEFLPASVEMRELGMVAVATTTEEAISVGTSRLSQATSEKRKLGDMASPMPSLNSRKKKKKKNTPKSKELLSFLSSLNDGRN